MPSRVAALTVGSIVFSSGVALAQTPTPEPAKHRLGLGGNLAATYLQAGSDGHDTNSYPRAGLRASYGYRLEPNIEFGAVVGFLPGSAYSEGSIVVPAGSMRVYLPIGARESFELGVTAELGLFTLLGGGNTWLGPSVAAAPDARLWVSDDIGLQLGGEFTYAKGKLYTERPASYLTDAVFLAMGGSFTILWRR